MQDSRIYMRQYRSGAFVQSMQNGRFVDWVQLSTKVFSGDPVAVSLPDGFGAGELDVFASAINPTTGPTRCGASRRPATRGSTATG
jgi:hypothetical protein